MVGGIAGTKRDAQRGPGSFRDSCLPHRAASGAPRRAVDAAGTGVVCAQKAAPALYAAVAGEGRSVRLVTVVRVSRSVLQQQLIQGEGFAV